MPRRIGLLIYFGKEEDYGMKKLFRIEAFHYRDLRHEELSQG
jgi:hypothetical protein